ncbi:ABC transporter substrate-binding protein [Nakamurella leprariae]|uniref:ABC transporter substrate-binding protein n=1 Tax=Nakamurella leprariae TaxID=2803911 RepID=A0A938YA39_9ACTN|nr:ABC transporter substrate-binding protein [Nakamurella leprariae]MBM9468751.1 ABC transporter substrate-binding protein [Nakamurella leprariae]
MTLGVAAVLAGTLALSACGSDSGGSGGSGSGGSGGGTWKIGLINNSAGAFADNNKTAIDGANDAIEQINAEGGINGAQIETVTVDVQGEPKNGTTLVPRLVQDGAVAIVGPVDSAATEIAFTVAKQLQIPAVSPGAGRPGVLDNAVPFGFTLAEADVDVSTPALLQIAKDKGYKTAAIIGDDVTATTKAQIPLFEDVFAQAGIDVVVSASFKTGDSSFASQVTQIGAAAPDVLALAAGPADAGRIAREVRSQGLDFDLLGTSSLQSGGAAYIQAGGDATDGTLSATQYDPTNPEEPAKGLLAAAEQASGLTDIPLNYAYAYDAVHMIAQVIEEQGLTADGDLAANRVAIQEGLKALTEYDGMAGRTAFKEDGTGDRPSLVAVVQGGEFVIEDHSDVSAGASN